LVRIHRVAMHQAFVQFLVHPLASWVRHLDEQRRQNHRLSILPDTPKVPKTGGGGFQALFIKITIEFW
jgi:hypothetical protein